MTTTLLPEANSPKVNILVGMLVFKLPEYVWQGNEQLNVFNLGQVGLLMDGWVDNGGGLGNSPKAIFWREERAFFWKSI